MTNSLKYISILSLPFKIVCFALLTFAIARTVFWQFYPDYFDLSWRPLFLAYSSGMRFDLAIVTMMLGPVFLVMLLPFESVQRLRVRIILSWLCCALLLALLMLYMADIIYFGEVNRHAGFEVFLLANDYQNLIDIALDSRLPLTLALLLSCLGIVLFWHYFLASKQRLANVDIPESTWKKLALYLTCIVLFTWFGRGLVISGKPINSLDAYDSGRIEAANLALNGAFVILKDVTRKPERRLHFFPETEVKRLSKQFLANDPEPFIWEDKTNIPNQRNIVFVLLESWSYKYIDGLSDRNYGVSPFMNSLVSQSQVWDNFYAAGQRSIQGIQAILTSIPVLTNQPALGYGLELNKMTRLGKIFSDAQYETLMIQSSNRRSFYMDGIASSLGFEHYYGKEDIPVIKKYPQETPRFGWDYDTLMFAEQKLTQLSKQGKPFFSFIFTGTTHEPYADPGKEFHIYPHDTASEQGFLNTLRYSDWSVQQFMEQASKQSWFNNTTFVFTADHVLKANSEIVPEQFHIPLIIYTPDQSLSPKRHQMIGSHYDLLPSLIDLAGLNIRVHAFGESLFDLQESRHHFVNVNKGELTGLIAQQGHALFSENNILSVNSSDQTALFKGLNHLKWRMQLADQKLHDNTWQLSFSSLEQTWPDFKL